MEPIYFTLIITIIIYLISHRYFKRFNLTAWVAIIGGLLIGTIYAMLTDDHFKSIPLKNNSYRIREGLSFLVENFVGSLLSFVVIAWIDKKIYGKKPRP